MLPVTFTSNRPILRRAALSLTYPNKPTKSVEDLSMNKLDIVCPFPSKVARERAPECQEQDAKLPPIGSQPSTTASPPDAPSTQRLVCKI